MNGERRTQEEAGYLVKYYAKLYSNLKFSQEVEIYNQNIVYKNDMDDLTQSIREEGASKQFLEYSRGQYEKSLKLNEIGVNIEDNSIEYISEFIYGQIIDSFSINKSHNSDFYKDIYLSAKESIIKYYNRYFEIKQEKQLLKDKHSRELKELTTEIREDGVAFYMIPAMYKDLRHSFKTKQTSPTEFAYYEELLNEIKDEILEDFEIISSNKIDSKSKITIDITREEAIERIEYIQTQIESENFGVLKEEWINSEDIYFAIDIKSKANKISRTLDYNKEKYNKFNLIEDINLKRLMDLPGIRLKKNHTYIIKIKD